jgi:Tfp pilus assembly protein PilO
MTGTYHDFGRFIGYVANFPFIANVSDVQLRAVNAAVTKQPQQEEDGLQEIRKKETMTAVFTLSTYFVKEEERLQELTL